MAVRPVDSLTMLPRLDQAARMLHQGEQHPYAFQHVLGTHLQEKVERGRTQVRKKAEAEQGTVQKDRQGGGGGQGARPQSGRRQAEPEPKVRPTEERRRLDVKV